MIHAKHPKDSVAIQTKVVLPHETNTLGKLFGGALLAWMDEIAAVAAHRHSKQAVVTVSVNHVSFYVPIDLGEIVTLKAKLSRAFGSSMEIIIDVSIEDRVTGEIKESNQAIYTFVAVDKDGKSIRVPDLIPQTDEEIERFDAALRRRQLSLVLGGKMKPTAATELKALFS